jgi:hypothetical protein
MNKYETPILLIIEDTFGTVSQTFFTLNFLFFVNYFIFVKIFGALISCALRMSENFYGTGETFLFTFYPEFQFFPWTGDNLFFVKGNADSILIGAGE